ncbi:MAG: hypothetical protein ACXV8X_14620 [Candidatus Angelobacter sp.]
MQVLTKTEAMDWLPRSGSEFDPSGNLGFRSGQNHVIAVPLPDKAYRLPYLANLLVTGTYDSPFVESLLWFTDWGVAGEVSNRVGFKLLQAMHTDTRPLIEAPARLFSPNEEIEAQSLLTLSLLMGWDAYFIPVTGKYFVFNSNDDFTDVVSNDDQTHQRFLAALKDSWGGKEW